ncbi:MAG: hypothetical protein FWF20_07100 [Betaproteobacteria bacterium]|nr:hypothetical protein [Betaproteobacteria bacterium]MCL2886536.1 hypothetical protein [Betaproteobacteria bacterium]
MATKLPKKQPAQEAPPDDLAVLFSSRDLTLSGETVTVREYSFGKQLKLGGELARLANAIAAARRESTDLVGANNYSPPDPLTALLDAIASEAEAFRILLAAACDRPPAWVDALKSEEGEALAITWWSVNCNFFLRRVRRPAELALISAALESTGAASSPPSSATATASGT